jgi:hypothetical protein
LIQWLYLSFCFAAAYAKLLEPPTKNTNEIPLPPPNPARFLSQLDDISKALDDALNEIHLVNKGIEDAITRFESSTSILKEKSRSNLGPSAHPAPTTIDCTVSPSLTTPPSGLDEDDPKDMANTVDAPIFSPHDTDDFDQEFADIDSFILAFISPETPPHKYANNTNMTATPTTILLPRGSLEQLATSMTSNRMERNPPQPHDSDTNTNKLKHTKIYNQNVQGLWCCSRDPEGNILIDSLPDTTKLENLINKMRQDNIGAWLVRETWEEGNHFDVEIGGYHIFRHNCTPGENGRSHLFKGVIIIISPLFYNAWRAAGSPFPMMTATTDKFAGRFISMTVQFDCYDSHGRCIKGKAMKCVLTSVYHPCNNDDHAQFCDTLDSLLWQIGIDAKTHLIMGADVNARLGKRECAEHSKIIGPHGIDQSNE